MVRARHSADREGAGVGTWEPVQSWGDTAKMLQPCPHRDLPAEESPHCLGQRLVSSRAEPGEEEEEEGWGHLPWGLGQ